MKKENKVVFPEAKCPICKAMCYFMAADSYFWDKKGIKAECPNKHKLILKRLVMKKYILIPRAKVILTN